MSVLTDPEWTPENLVAYMDLHGWSQRRLAETMGVHEDTMRRLMNGKVACTRLYRRAVVYANSSVERKHRCGACLRGWKSPHPHNRPTAASVQWRDY